MEKPNKKDWIVFGILVGAWAAVLLLPVLASWLLTRNWEYA